MASKLARLKDETKSPTHQPSHNTITSHQYGSNISTTTTFSPSPDIVMSPSADDYTEIDPSWITVHYVLYLKVKEITPVSHILEWVQLNDVSCDKASLRNSFKDPLLYIFLFEDPDERMKTSLMTCEYGSFSVPVTPNQSRARYIWPRIQL